MIAESFHLNVDDAYRTADQSRIVQTTSCASIKSTLFGQRRKSLTIQMRSLITAVQILPLKLDFYKVKMGIALYMKWLLKRTVEQQFDKVEDAIESLQDLRFGVQGMTSQRCFYANLGVM